MRDTIAAIASGITASGIGIVRISGPGAFRVLEKIFRFANPNKKVSTQKANTIHYGYIYDGDEKIDEVLVMLMKAPHTYTAEDTVEIDCHGGPYVMQQILSVALRSGARMAEPGEFTKRAFLNGRIDLSEAEAVMDVIGAGSEDALKSSIMQLGGSLKREITALREEIITEVAFIESALDDPEHYDLTGHTEEMTSHIKDILGRLDRLASSFNEGRLVREGIYTVILGKPNAGKSSLLNYVSGMERAIVTDIAGTTRDTLTEHIRMAGLSLNLTDTAGIRESTDRVEQIGVEKARKAAADADLLLVMIDGSVPLDKEDREILASSEGKQAVILLNKSDLPQIVTAEEIGKISEHKVIVFSAKDGTGLPEMEETVRYMFYHNEINFNDQIYVTSARHKNALEQALRSLKLVQNSISQGLPEDFFSIDLQDAYQSLGEITGETVGDDVIDRIFERFCTGK